MPVVLLEKQQENIFYNFVLSVDGLFLNPLSRRINFEEWIDKITKKGLVFIDINEINIIRGFISGYANNQKTKTAYINALAVSPSFQGQGISKRLLHEFILYCKKNKFKTIELTCDLSNIKARTLYSKFGFNEKEYVAGERVLMERTFSEDFYMNILLTSVGRRSYLVEYFKEALQGTGKVFVSNSDNLNISFKVADGSVISPLIYDSGYVDFLINYCEENEISLIIPLFDVDLPILAKNKEKFSKHGITVLVSSSDVIEKCNDKYLTYLFLANIGVKTPKTFLSIDNVLDAIIKKELSYPVFIKPRFGMGSLSIYQAENEEELVVLSKKSKREILTSYLKFESGGIDDCLIYQEKISGQEFGIDIINDLMGVYCNSIQKRKIAMRAGETDIAETVYDENIELVSKEISMKLQHIGNLDCDFIIDIKGSIYVIEMNARFGGGYPFSHIAGVNLPLAIINWVSDQKVDPELFAYRKGVKAVKNLEIVEL